MRVAFRLKLYCRLLRCPLSSLAVAKVGTEGKDSARMRGQPVSDSTGRMHGIMCVAVRGP